MSGSESVLIVLPLPPRILSPNVMTGSRGGRLGKAAAAKGYRAKARAAAEEQGVESGPWRRATVEVTFFFPGPKRRRDDVNFLSMLKPAYDGFVDSGLLEDDDSEHLTTLGARFESSPAARVELRVERVE